VSVAAHGVDVRGAYVVARAHDVDGYFTVRNDTSRPETLLGVLIGGLPAPLWHQRLILGWDDLQSLRGCGSVPNAGDRFTLARLHWGAITVPAHGAVVIAPGTGELDVPPGDVAGRSVRVELDFDNAGSVVVPMPLRES
jgi:copper(I)-binding protein